MQNRPERKGWMGGGEKEIWVISNKSTPKDVLEKFND